MERPTQKTETRMTARRRGRVKASDIKNTRRWTKEEEWAEDDGVDTPLHGKAHRPNAMQRQSISVSYRPTYEGGYVVFAGLLSGQLWYTIIVCGL